MNNKGLLVLIALLLLITAFLGYKVYQGGQQHDVDQEQISQVSTERDQIELELQKMAFSYDTLKTENSFMMAEMAAQRTQIEDLLGKVKDKNWSISKLKKETGTLRDIMKGYVVTIDSLNQLNIALIAKNDSLTSTVAAVQGKNVELEQRQSNMENMIQAGQILQAASIQTNAIRLSNGGKQNETTRARKADMLKSCFTVMENRIAKPGNKNLYVRILAPNGQVLPTKDGALQYDFAGGADYYSVSRDIDYNNGQMDVCVFYNVEGELESGDYTIFIYEGPNQIGTSSLALK